MRCGTSTAGWNFQMSSFSLQPSSKITYSTPALAAKSMNRSYVFVLQPSFAVSVSPLSKQFHQSHATLPGFTHEKSWPAAAGLASAHTASEAHSCDGRSASRNVRHGKVREPSVSTR